jgi:membrane associated rhomboid family serine protease
MFPISDDNPQPGVPVVTWAIIGVCVAVFLWQFSLPEDAGERAVFFYGMVPANLFGTGAATQAAIPAWATVLTSMFMHGGIAHIFGNMLYLWIFGDNVELAMGRIRFLVFYLVCGTIAALAQGLQSPASTIPLIGASGAISGVLGGYLVLQPFGRVRVLFMPIPFFIRVISVPAIVVLGLWFVIQFASGLASDPARGGVAFWAHVGGFIAGVALMPLFRRRDVPLMQPGPRRRFDARRGDEVPEADTQLGPWGRRRGPWDQP